MKASDFTVGHNYYLTDRKENVGADRHTRYKCVYVGPELALFVFEYQGVERVYSVYYERLDPSTFVRRIHQVASNEK